MPKNLDLAIQRSCQRRKRLMAAAQALRAADVAEAFGRCLALSLDLCLTAQHEGIAVDLVVWSVANDRHFLDHWAVMVDESTVVDLTRVQVDGCTELTHRLRDYPANFMRPRIYPAALLLPEYARCKASGGHQLSSRFISRSRWLLLRHDLSEALLCRSILRVGHSTLSLMKFCLVQSLGRLRLFLEARRDKLFERARANLQLDLLDDAESRIGVLRGQHRQPPLFSATQAG